MYELWGIYTWKDSFIDIWKFRQLTLLTCLDSTEVASLSYSMICDTVIFKVYFCSILIYEEVCDIQWLGANDIIKECWFYYGGETNVVVYYGQ